MPSETSLYKKDGKNKKPFKVFCQITSTLQVLLPHTGVGKEKEMIGRIKRETPMSNTSVLPFRGFGLQSPNTSNPMVT